MNKGRKKIFMTLWMAMIMLTMGAWAEENTMLEENNEMIEALTEGLMTDSIPEGLIAPLSEEVTNLAQIGSTKYATLQDAIAAVTDGQTIQLLDNIALTAGVEVTGNVSFTLDLNGKTLNLQNTFFIKNSGTGTLKIAASGGVGTISKSGYNTYAIWNASSGNIILSGGIVETSGNEVHGIYNSSSGTIAVSGGVVSTSGSQAHAIFNKSSGTVSISGGTVSASGSQAYGIFNQSSGTVSISGGIIESKNNIAISSAGTSSTVIILSGTSILKGGQRAVSKVPQLDYTDVQITASTADIDGNNVTVIDKGTLTDTSIKTYKYLKFEPYTPPAPDPEAKHTINFDANGGTVGEPSRPVDHNNAIGQLPMPTRSGYRFDGWFTAQNGGTQISAETIITEGMTFYAHWTYTGESDSGNGGGSSDSSGSGNSSGGGGGSSPIRPDSNTGGKKEEATVPETVAPEATTPESGANTGATTVQTVIAIGQNTAVITEMVFKDKLRWM